MKSDDLLLWNYKELGQSDELLEKYASFIHNIADLCKGIGAPNTTLARWFYGLFLGSQSRSVSNLLNVRDSIKDITSSLPYNDCYHELVCMFLQQAATFEVRRGPRRKAKGLPRTYFHHFIRTNLGWQAKNWLDKLATRHNTQLWDMEVEEQEPEVQSFSLTLDWVLNGCYNPLFTGLRPYDRYILYLYFAIEYDIRQIADATYQSKNTVNADLTRALDVCKENARSHPHQSLLQFPQSL
jgi:DNA-directed RNA polymerase specialized sigma24 family protein